MWVGFGLPVAHRGDKVVEDGWMEIAAVLRDCADTIKS